MADFYTVARRYNTRLHSKTRIRSWLSLPKEVRLLVLETLARDKHPGWSSAASVCKEWQLVIAKENLRKLKLESSCLDDFRRIIVQQKDLVRHIWLNIKLEEHTCLYCGGAHSLPGNDRNGALIASGIRKLFLILSKWEPGSGLTLELNAYSPSDSEHWFKGFHFATDDEASDGTACTKWHDPIHGWVHGKKVATTCNSAILCLFGGIGADLNRGLRRVDAVTCLVIRRQMRRRLAYWSLRRILGRLRHLEHIIYEPWRAWATSWVDEADSGMLTKSCRDLTLWNAFSRAFVLRCE